MSYAQLRPSYYARIRFIQKYGYDAQDLTIHRIGGKDSRHPPV